MHEIPVAARRSSSILFEEGKEERERTVRLARPRRRSVHNTQLRVPQEIGTSSKSVQHPAPERVRRVGVSVDVDFERSVHGDDTQTANDFGGVGDLLGAEEELVHILVPVGVEGLEHLWGESD
jgi:hypothetical protein